MSTITNSGPDTGPSGEQELTEACEALHELDTVVRPQAVAALRGWRRDLRGSPDPLPDSHLADGAAIATELLRLVVVAGDRVTAGMGGQLPAWAAPLVGYKQELQEWLAMIASPCLDIAAVIMDGMAFLLQVGDTIKTLEARVVGEIGGRRHANSRAGNQSQDGRLQRSHEDGLAQVKHIRALTGGAPDSPARKPKKRVGRTPYSKTALPCPEKAWPEIERGRSLHGSWQKSLDDYNTRNHTKYTLAAILKARTRANSRAEESGNQAA